MHCMCMRPKSHPSYQALLQHYGTIAHQAPLSMGFSRQEYRSGLPLHPLEDLSDPGIEPVSLAGSCTGRQILTT